MLNRRSIEKQFCKIIRNKNDYEVSHYRVLQQGSHKRIEVNHIMLFLHQISSIATICFSVCFITCHPVTVMNLSHFPFLLMLATGLNIHIPNYLYINVLLYHIRDRS
jgi:hypothetical protein